MIYTPSHYGKFGAMVIKITLPNSVNPSLFPTGKGISITDQTVKFEGYTEQQVSEITQRFWRKSMPDGTNITLKTLRKAKALTDDEVSGIKPHLPDAYDPKRHSIYKIGAANTKLDRDNDQFTPAYLKAMAKAVNDHGAALLFNHGNDNLIGKVFHATVMSMDGDPMHTELIEYAMISPDATLPGQPGYKILQAIEDGVLNNASVRFGRWKSEIKEAGGQYIRIIDVPEMGEMVHPETSLVFFPAQIGAGLKLFAEGGNHEEFNFKSFNPQIINKSLHSMPKIEHELKFGDKPLKVTAELDGEVGKFAGLSEVQTALNDANAKMIAAEKELSEAKQPSINNILNLSGEKGLKKSYIPAEAELKTKSLKELQAMETDLTNELRKSQPENQLIKATPANEEGEKEKEKAKSVSPSFNL